jgi:hypothetical protein
LSLLNAKSCLESFLQFLEPSRYFSDIKNDFSLFLKIIFNFKNRISTKNKIFSNPSNIYGWNPLIDPFPKFKTTPSDSIRNFRNRLPKFEGGSNSTTTPASIYFRSVCLPRNSRVSLHLSRRELRLGAFDLSIRPTVHPQSTILCSTPAGSSSPVSLHHCYT